jgi:hypothetical protein
MGESPAELFIVILGEVMRIGTLFFLLGLFTAPLAAQGPARAGLSSPIVHRAMNPAAASGDSGRRLLVTVPDSIRQSHWAVGMGIGAGAGLVGWALVRRSVFPCDTPNCGSATEYLIPMALFAVIGGLIGSMFH